MAAVEHLGITVDDVRAQRISPQIAERIVKKHTDLSVKDITALAFDTLYKQLCATGRLQNSSGAELVAPFAFISVLAGAFLLLEVIQRVGHETMVSNNEWRLSPWRAPFPGGRQLRPRRADCECCGRPQLRRFRAATWSSARRVPMVEGFSGRIRCPVRLRRFRVRLSRYWSTSRRKPSGKSSHGKATAALTGGSTSMRDGQPAVEAAL